MNTNYKLISEFCRELGMEYLNEEILDNIYKLVDAGIDLETLIQLLNDIKKELDL